MKRKTVLELPMEAYNKLLELAKNARLLQGVSSVLCWDQETYMPSGAGPIRSEQLKLLAGLVHEKKTSKEYALALGQLIDLKTGGIIAKGLGDDKQAAVRGWYRDYRRDTALPQHFVEDFAQLTSQSLLVWSKAKTNNAFHHFAPFLDKIVAMSRKKADYLGYKDHPYDALLDLYEPEITTKQVAQLFSELKAALVPLLKKTQSRPQVDDSFLHGVFPVSKQTAFGKMLLKDMGYDMTKGRLDFSSHPFSIASHPTDSRITTRVNPKFALSNISVVLHEAGHSLYEMGLPAEEFGSPLGESISLGIHESQSRWWETRIGHSRHFWEHYLPRLKKAFKGKFEDCTLDAFYKGINKVNPALIRVEADEVTYSLHVILRFEIEKSLIEGSLKVRDIPEAWNAKMKELLGVTPTTYSEGCLQDIHWSMGAFGYFPTYALGNMYASHFFKAFEKQHPNWTSRVASGELTFIGEWLHSNIHKHGRRYSSLELLKNVTGKPFTADAFVEYLTDKYSKIYGF